MKTAAVIVGRDDNYGENLHHRAKLCLNNLAKQFDKIFYVDWKTLNKTLTESASIQNPKISTISVSLDYIQIKYPQYVNYPIVESIARNIGIRSAIDENYDWVLSTNIDCIMDDINFNDLSINTLYTARRRNVPESYHLNNKITLELLKTNKDQFSIAPLSVIDGKAVWDKGDIWSLVVCCGDFQLAHASLWSSIRGFEEAAAGRAYGDSNLMKKPKMIGKNTNILDIDLFHLDHSNKAFRLPNEILPLNDMYVYVENFQKSTNSKNWGLL